MKPDIHPDYNFVVFKDTSSDFSFLTRSTKSSKETIKWEDGKEYPLILLEITSGSHPFYTGKQQLIDSAGRVEKFMKKYGKITPKAKAAKPEKATGVKEEAAEVKEETAETDS